VVPGEGPPDADIMLIGEGPGYHEDRQGRPFVGRSGQFLNELLQLASLERTDVFIANVIKCRAPKDRDPLPEEIDTCTKAYLFRQIEAIDPRVIVTLGRFSMSLYLKNERITRIHGNPRRIDNRLLIPMMHPAAALHQPKNRDLIMEDFRRLPEHLAKARELAEEAESPKSAAHQQEHGSTQGKGKKGKDDDQPSVEQLSMF
jgi:DNA polymerase